MLVDKGEDIMLIRAKGVIRGVIRRASLFIVTRRARPAPSLPPSLGILVVAPHPDDETLGCGALLARLAEAGNLITVVFATDGEAAQGIPSLPLGTIRRQEALEACGELGIKSDRLVFLGLEDGSLVLHQDALELALDSWINRGAADVVLVTASSDRHPDHRAAADVVKRLHGRYRFDLWQYPIWTWKSWPWGEASDSPLRDALRRTVASRFHRVSSDRYLHQKRLALGKYRSQLGPREDGKTLPKTMLDVLLGRHELFTIDPPPAQ